MTKLGDMRARLLAVCAVVIALLACAALAGCSSGGGEPSKEGAAAFFGDHVISEDEVTQYTQDFRASNNLEDDEQWGNYLITNGMSEKEWRENVIRQKADRILIEDKARELGITADEAQVDDRIEQDKRDAGIDSDDVQAWADYLAGFGQTPESHRDAYEYSSIQQQVYTSEIDFTSEMESEMCNDYLYANLADHAVRHYRAIEFGKDEREAAQAALDELSGLSGDELVAALDRKLAERAGQGKAGDSASTEAGDLGWDFVYDEGAIDPDLKLRMATLYPISLFGEVLEGEDALRVVACVEREDFVDIDYDSIQSDSLKELIASLAKASNWTALCLNYTNELEAEANVQVATMPEGLPYDVGVEAFLEAQE